MDARALKARRFRGGAGLDHEARLRDRRISERRNAPERSVLLPELLNVAEFDRAFGAAFDADGIESLRRAVETPVALRHLALLRVELRHAVRTGLRAESAADALRFVDDDETVFGALHMGLGRTHLDAGRLSAFVAADRNVVGEDVLTPGAVLVFLPAPAFHFENAAEVKPRGRPVLVGARDGTRAAARAAGDVNVEAFLCHFP